MKTLELGKPNQDVVAETLLDIAYNDPQILVVTGDSRGSAKMTDFGKKFPERMIEVGIAEQNLVGVAAGLASTGKKVFAFSPACFLTARALEQIKNDVAYSNQPVRLIGISAGVSYGALGGTHHSLHDLAALQAIHNIDIVVPADNFETAQAILSVIDYDRPVYLRFGKRPVYHLHDQGSTFEIGKAILIREGRDLTFIAIGEAVAPAVFASYLLEENGVSCGVVSFHTLRPLDIKTLLGIAESSRALITVEEHSIFGGLGTTVAATLMEAGIFRPLKRVGIPDEHTVTGSQTEIFNHYGLTPESLAKTALALLESSHLSRWFIPQGLNEKLEPDTPSN
jgi:transketolase